jgi:alkylhydroperoxidase family enzyme
MALCEWAAKLTLTPAKCSRADVNDLRSHGWTDEQIVSAAQIVGFFNHLNRLADGLGIDLEPEMLDERGE